MRGSIRFVNQQHAGFFSVGDTMELLTPVGEVPPGVYTICDLDHATGQVTLSDGQHFVTADFNSPPDSEPVGYTVH